MAINHCHLIIQDNDPHSVGGGGRLVVTSHSVEIIHWTHVL